MMLAAALANSDASTRRKPLRACPKLAQLQEQRTMCRSRRHTSARHTFTERRIGPTQIRVLKLRPNGVRKLRYIP
jgi:hypothetical protein